jgi:hypothetical protein
LTSLEAPGYDENNIVPGGAVGSEKADPALRQALSSFYREEFLRHLEQLELNGLVNEGNRAVMTRTCTKLMADLDQVCCRDDFPAVAETLLQNFELLTRLSELDPRQAH